ncbi:MAG: hypothetical protein EVA65_13260 [Oceanococcus sp.]|nr:MAG: hypothetical protein EVA65_13260 [Oceanococcus sp.]
MPYVSTPGALFWAPLAAVISLSAAASDPGGRAQRYHPEVITLPDSEPPQLDGDDAVATCALSGYSLAPQFFVKRASRERQICAAQTPSDMLADNHSVLTLEQPESH